MTLTIEDALAAAASRLASRGIENPRREARLLLSEVLHKDTAWLIAHDGDALDDTGEFERLIERRVAHEPISRIVGRREFWSLEFELTPATLDPRPDSETLVEAVLSKLPNKSTGKVLDIGTGSGCLLLSVLFERRAVSGIGTDISTEALACARQNAERLGLTERTHFVETSWAAGVAGPFDVILSNPPYIPSATIGTLAPEVVKFDPMAALDGGPDGLDAYRAIIRSVKNLITPGGCLLFEVGVGQSEVVSELLSIHGYEKTEDWCDLSGIKRVVGASLPKTSK